MSEDKQRTSTDILLSIETKLDTLLKLYQTVDMNSKIQSNKLNSLIEIVNTLPKQGKKSPFVVEAVDTKPSQPSQPKKQESREQFSRTSRPETHSSPNVLPEPPQSSEVEFIEYVESTPPTTQFKKMSIPVSQRIVDDTNRAIFLAEVELHSLPDDKLVTKIKTNAVGKWSTTLGTGKYRVEIRKSASATRAKIEHTQFITIDDKSETLSLPLLTLKSSS